MYKENAKQIQVMKQRGLNDKEIGSAIEVKYIDSETLIKHEKIKLYLREMYNTVCLSDNEVLGGIYK